MEHKPSLADRIDQKLFDAIYSRSLVYNTCWEDPAVDRRALNITPADTMLVITSAGCNVLDYALAGPRRIHAVDANPRQTALLDLKLAGIRALSFEDFFGIFGEGFHPRFRELYFDALRDQLSPFTRAYWDRRTDWFQSRIGSFYYHGLAGIVARAFRLYLRARPKLATGVYEVFDSRSLEDQRRLYDSRVDPFMWGAGMNWALSRQMTMSMLGVPVPQRKQVQAQHDNGVAGFVRDSIEYVFRQLPIWNNYFWAVYIFGRYSEHCCPEYLKRENFEALKAGMADCIRPHTCTVTQFLHSTDERISKFVLLDHMDWMSSYHPKALAEEWAAILEKSAPRARIIFRSAHATPAYLDHISVGAEGRKLEDVLDFHEALAHMLQHHDRVHTYAGFHIADVRV